MSEAPVAFIAGDSPLLGGGWSGAPRWLRRDRRRARLRLVWLRSLEPTKKAALSVLSGWRCYWLGLPLWGYRWLRDVHRGGGIDRAQRGRRRAGPWNQLLAGVHHPLARELRGHLRGNNGSHLADLPQRLGMDDIPRRFRRHRAQPIRVGDVNQEESRNVGADDATDREQDGQSLAFGEGRHQALRGGAEVEISRCRNADGDEGEDHHQQRNGSLVLPPCAMREEKGPAEEAAIERDQAQVREGGLLAGGEHRLEQVQRPAGGEDQEQDAHNGDDDEGKPLCHVTGIPFRA